MHFEPLLFLIKAKYEEAEIKNKKESYSTDILVGILRNLRKDNQIKTWSEIENKYFNKKENKDNRTAKQIEEDVLNSFKNWAG